jgi:hypothetical protein
MKNDELGIKNDIIKIVECDTVVFPSHYESNVDVFSAYCRMPLYKEERTDCIEMKTMSKEQYRNYLSEVVNLLNNQFRNTRHSM